MTPQPQFRLSERMTMLLCTAVTVVAVFLCTIVVEATVTDQIRTINDTLHKISIPLMIVDNGAAPTPLYPPSTDWNSPAPDANHDWRPPIPQPTDQAPPINTNTSWQWRWPSPSPDTKVDRLKDGTEVLRDGARPPHLRIWVFCAPDASPDDPQCISSVETN